MPGLASILVGGPVEPWARLGLTVDPSPAVIRVGVVHVRIEPAEAPAIVALGIDDLAADLELDGLRFHAASPNEPTAASHHSCAASLVDHVVVMTSSLERTSAAVEEGLGAPLRRIREVGPGVRQGFHRLGEVILEVVETPQVRAAPAEFWGLVFVVDDLERWADSLGPELTSPPKTAVQPGRRISNVRRPAGLPCPIAFMSPDPRHR
jgi:hypothetical protein